MRFSVKPYVDDRELEDALNKVLDDGGELFQIYRNAPDSNGNENCTIIYTKKALSADLEKRINQFRSKYEGCLDDLLQTGDSWAKSLDLWVEPTAWKGDGFFKEFIKFDKFVGRCMDSAHVELGGLSGKKEAEVDSEGAGQGFQPVDQEAG